MFSVTNRIKAITQPRGGYLSPRKLQVLEFTDRRQIAPVTSKYKAIQGMAVDYLTRFLIGMPKEEAFRISLLGAKAVFQPHKAMLLLSQIRGTDKTSIVNACKLTGYDVAHRVSPRKFIQVDKIQPPDSVIRNIRTYVARTVKFLNSNGPVVLTGATFPGGYTEIVTSGDCDYVTSDTLWDLKTSDSPPSSKDTLQLLMYYILGLHSIHPEFRSIHSIGIFNPILNCAYTIPLSQIPDKVFQRVSREVLGYQTPDDPRQWRLASGTDPHIYTETFLSRQKCAFATSSFLPDHFEDGIYDITIDDYCAYWERIHGFQKDRPSFAYTASIKFLRREGFSMFLSVSETGSICLLNGGRRKKLSQNLEYYYENMARYARIVLARYSKYWNALYELSRAVQSIPADPEIVRETEYADYVRRHEMAGGPYPDFDTWWKRHPEKQHLTGTVHGCIVDLDFSSHLYLNPYIGTIAPYFALSMEEKFVYPNVASLLSEHRPEMLPGFVQLTKEQPNALIASPPAPPGALVRVADPEVQEHSVLVTDTSMYALSNRLIVLQQIYDHNVICAWHDHFLDLSIHDRSLPALPSGENKP